MEMFVKQSLYLAASALGLAALPAPATAQHAGHGDMAASKPAETPKPSVKKKPVVKKKAPAKKAATVKAVVKPQPQPEPASAPPAVDHSTMDHGAMPAAPAQTPVT